MGTAKISFIHCVIVLCGVPRFQKNYFLPIVDVLFNIWTLLIEMSWSVVSAWSSIADSLLLQVPGLCSKPRSSKIFLFLQHELTRKTGTYRNFVNNSFRLDLIWAVFGLLKIMCECFYRLKCGL